MSPEVQPALSPPLQSPLVRVGEGWLQGSLEDEIAVFRGVPYAQPPIGELRFRPPRPVTPWDNTLRATQFAPAAPQPRDAGLFVGDPDAMPPVAMSEDCLYLNIWAPAAKGSLPVLVWLHGGSQILGGASRPVYDGAVFARQGIVCVTLGFRLGALGNLELGEVLGAEYAGSGNNCLSDQISALRWVHANIAAFGGDAQRITLGGESAGAKNVAVLMACPAARGLFQSAIVLSGGAETVHDVSTAAEVARKFVALSGRPARELPAMEVDEILAVQERLLASGGRRFPFRPVFGTAILPDMPLHGLRKRIGGQRALLIGTTRDEMGPWLGDDLLLAGWQDQFLSHCSPREMTAVEERAVARLPHLSVAQRRRQLAIAEEYWVPSIRVADANSGAGCPTWMYRFDLELPSSPLAGTAPHTADLSPVWKRAGPYDLLPGQPAARMNEAVVQFVHERGGDWPIYDPARRTTALIGERLVLSEDPGRVMFELLDGLDASVKKSRSGGERS